ncbi:hypothetical protein [Kitasatospora sp. NPDC087315]|uniref:hypothetical protein n=1 Tax=Kitasatospora sp. NPDC087315 TaxID=3364069 RepID=UPI0038071561
MTTIMAPTAPDLEDLYTRYSGRLLAAATERLAAISPAAIDLDEDITQEVWLAVAAGHYPTGRHGLDGLIALLDSAVRKVRAVRAREHTAGIAHPARRTATPVDLDALAETTPVVPAPARPLRPAVSSHAFAGLLGTLPLAG